jgi:hypothetical protein
MKDATKPPLHASHKKEQENFSHKKAQKDQATRMHKTIPLFLAQDD